MYAEGTPATANRRTRAKTAKIEFPLPASPSTRLSAISNGQYIEGNFPRLSFVKHNPNYGQAAQSSIMPQQRSGVIEGSGKTLPGSGVFQAHLALPLPLRPPPPINPKLRILKTAKSFLKKVDIYEDNSCSRVDREWPRPLEYSKMTKDFPKEAQCMKEASETITTKRVTDPKSSFGNGEGACGVEANGGTVDDGDLTPDMNRLKENEEKMQLSSESLHMDHAGLKQFPILGPNDRHVRLLSLQHNSISRLQNLVVLSHLIVLDLYCNRIERISGLQSFHCLRVLLLGKNRIRRMEGLEGLRRLEILDLHGNQLRYLDNLNAIESLRIINVAGNAIRSIRNFGPSGLGSLVELNLKRNRLRSLTGLEKAPNLKKLLISNNELQKISCLNPLTKLTALEELLLESNPFCSIPEYTNQVLSLLPSLLIFDRVSINDEMRQDTRNWQRRALARDEEESRRVPPHQVHVARVTSRDEVIQQAQRRWESLRDYVKDKSNHSGNWGNGSRATHTSKEALSSHSRNTKLSLKAVESYENSDGITEMHAKVKWDLNETFSKKEDLWKPRSDNANLQAGKSEVKVDTVPFECSPSPKLTNVAIVRPRIRKQEENIPPDAITTQNTAKSFGQVPQVSGKSTPEAINPVASRSVKRLTNTVYGDPSNNLTIKNQLEIQRRLSHLPEANASAASGQLEQVPEERKVSQLSRSFSLNSILPGDLPGDLPGNDSMSTSSSSLNLTEINARGLDNSEVRRNGDTRVLRRPQLLRSNSVDTHFQNSEELSATNISVAVPMRRRSSASVYRHVVPRRSKQRGQTAKPSSSAPQASPRLSSFRRPMTGIREADIFPTRKPLKRVKSLTTISPVIRETIKKQGSDYLMEIDGKTLSLFGQGALKQFLTWFPEEVTEMVDCIKFHFITYDTIVPHFEKLRQTYPSAEHFHFRANNLAILAQLNAIADLQGITSIHINPEGNPIAENSLWENYAVYRLAHWGLKQINGKEVVSDYYGGGLKLNEESKVFESLGYLALSCLPQSMLTPLATKLHTLQTFCCCSQSNSSEDSGRKKADSTDSSDNVCNSWDSDPVLLDVIGKEALVYNYPKNEGSGLSEEIASAVVKKGCVMMQKLNKLEENLPEVLQRAIEDILIDYICLENFMKKELKKVKDVCVIQNKKV